MRSLFRLFAMLCALFGAASAGAGGPGVTVFAAASLREALDEVARAHDGDVTISYGGSGLIARQVAQGAPADLVLLAHTAWMDWLAERGAIETATRTDLLGNRLVLVGPVGAPPLDAVSPQSLLDRLDGGRMAMGQTAGVPAGIYGRQWLERAGIWPDLAAHLAETDNVRAALALVARHEAPLGVVYATDARAEPGVAVVYDIPGDLHDRIAYPVAVVQGRDRPEVLEFLAFLGSARASAIFRAHGFAPPEDPA